MTEIADEPMPTLGQVLQLETANARTTEDIFTGVSQRIFGRVFGGQVLAQAVVAASRTVSPDRAPHSMHGYFLRPGDASQNITFSVDRIHDGRSFSTRRTQAFQEGIPIFSMIASFQDESAGLEHEAPMPRGIPQPESLSDPVAADDGSHPLSARVFRDRPLDVRHVDGPIYTNVENVSSTQAVWMRTRDALPDDPQLHRAALAYMSDLTIQETILRAHGVAWDTPKLRVASLDHAMWWHRDGRADEWVLYVQESPSAQGGRGLATGRIYTRDGRLLASVAQEVMVRVPQAPA